MSLFSKTSNIPKKVKEALTGLDQYDDMSKVEIINEIKVELHRMSPMKAEPVDCVLWVSADLVEANDYNPNAVAPPEMKLLEHSILEDGYTQPIVTWLENGSRREVIDGFHRNRVGKECKKVQERIQNFLPVVTVNQERTERGDRIAATIRHNRARGKHQIDGMSKIVIELKKRNWSDKKIGKNLGMDPDEVLRLTQISGLAEMFEDKEFTEAWEAQMEDTINEDDGLSVIDEENEVGLLEKEERRQDIEEALQFMNLANIRL